LYGLLWIAGLQSRLTEQVVGREQGLVQIKRPAGMFDGCVQLSLLEGDLAAVQLNQRRFGEQHPGLNQIFLRRVRLTLLEEVSGALQISFTKVGSVLDRQVQIC